MTTLNIVLTNDTCSYTLYFNIYNTPIARKWLAELDASLKSGSKPDDPTRFYGPASSITREDCIKQLNKFINTINAHEFVCDRHLHTDYTQDDLNYLHSIFENYHGLYGEQHNNEYFRRAPDNVQYALGQLNIWIHRLESVDEYSRFVCTFANDGRPRLEFDKEDYLEFTHHEHWGGLYLNYCEIGKTLIDFYRDDDQHIGEEAFKPQRYYKADFNVKFTHYTEQDYDLQYQKVLAYYDRHRSKFERLGLQDPDFALGSIKVGTLLSVEDYDKEHFERELLRNSFIESLHIDYA